MRTWAPGSAEGALPPAGARPGLTPGAWSQWGCLSGKVAAGAALSQERVSFSAWRRAWAAFRGYLLSCLRGATGGTDEALSADTEVVEKPAKEETVIENATPDYAAGLVSTQVGSQPEAHVATAPSSRSLATKVCCRRIHICIYMCAYIRVRCVCIWTCT